MTTHSECKCSSCQNACSEKPGWFLPGEAEKLAEHFGVSFEEIFKTKLAVDWWEADDKFENDVFVLSPNVVNGIAGEEFGADPKGVCVFFVDGECSIHEVKPFECGSLMHTDSHEKVAERHLSTAHAWNNDEAQNSITEYLGREPISSEYISTSIFEMFGSTFAKYS